MYLNGLDNMTLEELEKFDELYKNIHPEEFEETEGYDIIYGCED